MEVGNVNVWIFLQKPKFDTHQICMNGPSFHEAYSPEMYEFMIKFDFYPIFFSSFCPIFREKTP
jgi:hypothetical protein